MTDRQEPPDKPTPKPQKPRPADSAFDIWLNRGLHQLFDDVASEPVPDNLLNLIQAAAVPTEKKTGDERTGDKKTGDRNPGDKKS